MAGDDRTAEERECDAEIGRRLQEELPGYRARFEPDPDPDPDPKPHDQHDAADVPEPDAEADDEDGPQPTLFNPLYQEGGCFDPKGCLPWWIVLPGAVLHALGGGWGTCWRGWDAVSWAGGTNGAEPGGGRHASTSAQIGPPLRPPAEWADAQRAFRSTYAADPESVPRRPATIAHDGALVTVVLRDGRGRRMTFETTPDTTALPVRGEVDGFLVGELGTNATAGVEVAGGVLWPVYNPVGR